jgi:hypothetical protein
MAPLFRISTTNGNSSSTGWTPRAFRSSPGWRNQQMEIANGSETSPICKTSQGAPFSIRGKRILCRVLRLTLHPSRFAATAGQGTLCATSETCSTSDRSLFYGKGSPPPRATEHPAGLDGHRIQGIMEIMEKNQQIKPLTPLKWDPTRLLFVCL